MSNSQASTLFLGFGSNLGDRKARIIRGIMSIAAQPGFELIESSPLYESPAMLPEEAPSDWNRTFLNAVASYRTTARPNEILAVIQAVEMQAGKTYRGHWAPRELDVDFLALDDRVIDSANLQVPHPHLHERDFVLLPWRDIAPDWKHPVVSELHGKTIAELCDLLPSTKALALQKRAA